MVRFLSRLALLAAILLMVIIGMHAVAIWNMQDELKSAYTISPSTEVLFLGSSQTGCSIDEDESQTYRLRKLWVSETIAPSCLMRLRELERRGQLERVKTVVVPFNVNSVTVQTRQGYLWAWYLELPVSWPLRFPVQPGSWASSRFSFPCGIWDPFRHWWAVSA